MSWRGVAGGICGEYRFLSDPQTEGLCSVEDILVDDLFGDDLKRSGLHRFGACIEGAVGNCLFDAAVDAFAQQIEDQILTTVGEGRVAIALPVDVRGHRSAERRVGNEGVGQYRTRVCP